MTTYTMTGVTCNNCGGYADSMGINAAEARAMVASEGWVRKGNKDYCPRCYGSIRRMGPQGK